MNREGGKRAKKTFDVVRLFCYNKDINVTLRKNVSPIVQFLSTDTLRKRVKVTLVAVGYARDNKEQSKFRWLCSLCMLANRHPSVEAFSALTISTVNDLLPDISGTGQMKGRQVLMRLQTSLCYLGILDEPVVLGDPTQWDESLAAEYVAYTCNDAVCGDLMLPSSAKYRWFQNIPQQLSPGGINSRLRAMRSFFSHLQRRPYTVDGKHYPRLQVTWLPHETFRTPDDVKAACQPNPKDIQEDTWFKLIWAACTLTKEKLGTARNAQYPLAYYRAACLIWVTASRRSDEIRRLHVGCVRREWAPEMRDEQGQQIEPEAELAYLRVPINKMKGDFYIPIPLYVADAIEVWESMRPPNQKALIDRKTRRLTHYLFQYRNELMGTKFLNDHAIPLLCKLAGVSQMDVVGRITSHRARATTATWMHKMGMAPADIGKLLGHTDPLRSLPWYLREDKHHLGRAYRKANPLERYVAAILDTNAHARQEPCVFYYLSDGPDGRPRMCGNPHFSRCIHQLMCIECEAFIDHEQAEAIEKREGAIVISVPIPLPPQMVAELNEQDEAGSDARLKLETLPPPTLPGPAFHFNKKVPLRSAFNEAVDLRKRLAQVETQIAKKQGKTDRRSASLQALLREQAELQARLEAQEKGR